MTHSPGQRPPALPSLTGVRFFACGTVVLAHVLAVSRIFSDAQLQLALGGLVPLATNAVTLFFVLSGFVLTWAASPGDTARRFWRRRAAKVLPNHVVTCTAAAVLVALYGVQAELSSAHGSWHPLAVVANLFLVHVWLPDGDFILAAHPVTWSLACEALFYLLFPVLILVVRRIRPARLPVWALATAAATVCVPSLSLLLAGPPFDPQVPVSELQFWAAYVFPVSRLPEFVLGMLLARLVAEGWRPPRLRYGVPTLFLVVVVGLALPPVFVFGPLSAGPAGLVTAALAVRSLGAEPFWLERPWLVALGRRTYACYISHFVVVMYVRQYVTGPGTSFGVPVALAYAALMVVLSALVAWALYRFVECPVMARLAPPRAPADRASIPGSREPVTDPSSARLEKP
ncbi:acyltransferase [Streptomyces olivaceiscleroticus]|uniref:Acyltransferase n=1 Tax=Streptomyces olivaceiscleroticus TaxID=68245 RepID=A0ABN0ZJC6_9ACTN